MRQATQLRYETHVRTLKKPNIMHRRNWITTAYNEHQKTKTTSD